MRLNVSDRSLNMSNPAGKCEDRFAEVLFLFLASVCQVLRFLCYVLFSYV